VLADYGLGARNSVGRMQAAEDDDEQEYQRLLHFMTRPGPRFAMALARYRDATVARTFRDRLVVDAASRECRASVLKLSGADAAVDIVARLKAAIGHDNARIDVLFVVGLESLLIDDLGDLRRAPSVSNLNQRRDRLPELLDARVVWWIGEWAFAAYATQLRDLSEVMRTSVRFSGRIESSVEPGRSEEPETVAVEADIATSRSRAVTMGKVADLLEARGELDEALRIRREQLPVFERLGNVRELLVGRANLALNLLVRGRHEDIPESAALLAMALRDARRLQIPEAAQIAGIVRQLGIDPDVPPFV
jgi:hypothetical protein